MSKVFVIAETANGAAELGAAARSMGNSVALCMAGVPAVTGVADVCIHIDVPSGFIVDDAYLSVIKAFEEEGASVVLAENTSRALSLVGRLAAAKGAAAITGVMSFEDLTATSMYYGGVGTRAAAPAGDVAVYVVNAGICDAATATGTDEVKEVSFEEPATTVKLVSCEALPPAEVNLAEADTIISCGRGFAKKEELDGVFALAKKIGAEVGCSRPLAEAEGWFPREAYIGISGAMLSPKTAIILGVSGQMQHMIGLNDSGTIIAVNKDKNAPVFNMCDYGYVGNVTDALDALNAAL